MKILSILLLAMLAAGIPANAQLPRISMTGDFGDEYAKGTLTLTDEDGTTAEYDIKAKWRGHSAKQYTKKSFAVKLIDDGGESLDASLLGMRNDNNWILDAMAVDMARMRNRVSFDLWNDFASDTYVKREYEPKSFNGTHGRFVELTLNGAYHGVYCLTEKIDRKQLKLKKYKNGTVHGVLYKADGWTGTMFWDYEDYDNASATWMGWESQYPDVDDEGTAEYTPLANAIKFVLEASTEEFQAEVADYFDLPVWTDFFIFVKVINAVDNEGKNTFAYIYDIEQDKKLSIAPWDLDATWGRSYDTSEWTSQTVTFANNLAQRLIKEYAGYDSMMSERYFDLRKTFFDVSSLKSRFTAYFDYLNGNGALERETERWNGENDIALDFAAEQQFISEWIDERLAYLDAYFEGLPSSIHIPTSDSPDNNRYYNLNGQPMTGTPTAAGLYIKNGKKVVVR